MFRRPVDPHGLLRCAKGCECSDGEVDGSADGTHEGRLISVRGVASFTTIPEDRRTGKVENGQTSLDYRIKGSGEDTDRVVRLFVSDLSRGVVSGNRGRSPLSLPIPSLNISEYWVTRGVL